MAEHNINDVFDSIMNDCKAVAVSAIKSAAKKVQKDIVDEANDYLKIYYRNYKPKSYKRTYRLKRAIKPFWSNKVGKRNISIEVGVQYNSSALKGLYRSNSRYHQSGDTWRVVTDYDTLSSDNGIPEPDWIMENFLEGVHPWAQTDSQSTYSMMESFFNVELPNRISAYMENDFIDILISRLEGGGK